MEVEIRLDARTTAALAILAALLLFGVTGYAVTPTVHGEAQALTPDRWQARKLERKAYADIRRLRQEVDDMRSMLENGRPDPVDAMLLAQRVYAHERKGVSATAPARRAAIDAARTVAEYASGTAERNQAISAVNAALEAVESLTPKPAPVRQDGKVFLPMVGGRG